MGKNRLRAGIIGCGSISHKHVSGYRENGVEVTALADIREESLDAVASEVPAAKCFQSYEELICSGLVDAVSICTPPVAQEEAILYGLNKGVHIICEKPLCNTPEGANRIKEAVEQSDSVFMVAFRHRFMPANAKMKEMIDSGKIGAPVMFRNVFGGPNFEMEGKWFVRKEIAGGGCMLDTNSHSVDLFRFLLGEIREQHGVTHQHFQDSDVEDAGVLIVKGENGALGTMGSSFVLGDGLAFIDIIGQDGRLLYDYTKPDVLRYKKREAEEWEKLAVQPSNGFTEQISHFINVIKGQAVLQVGASDGLRAQEIVQTCSRVM